MHPLPQRTLAIVCALSASLLVGACANPRTSASSYSAAQVGREQTVRLATVEAVRVVHIDKGQTGVGMATGAVVGGLAGGSVSHGRESVLGAVIGAVAGGIAGQAIENSGSQQEGLEITVRLDSGEQRVIVQAADGQQFIAGDRVRLLSGAGGTRVTR